MTRIERAVREVSDLRDFYRRIPKIGVPESRREGHAGGMKTPAAQMPANARQPRETGSHE